MELVRVRGIARDVEGMMLEHTAAAGRGHEGLTVTSRSAATSDVKTVNGLSRLISGVLAVANGVLAFLKGREATPPRIVALAILLTGVVLIGVTVSVLGDVGSSSFGFHGGPG
jgi:hypothetical protein